MLKNIKDKTLDTFYLTPMIHINDNREILIENCKRIEEYNDVFMKLISGNLCIQIWGNSLRACDFKTKGLIISGRISQIEFIERRKHNEKSDKGLCEDKCGGEKSV